MTAERVCGVAELEQDMPLRVEPNGVPITVIKDSAVSYTHLTLPTIYSV